MSVYPKYDGKCVTCRYYDLSPIDRGYKLLYDDHLQYGFYCSERHGNFKMTDSCYCYKEDPYVSNDTIERAENWLSKYTSYRFYVVSTICEILKLPIDSKYMQAFNKLRDFSFSYPNGIKNLYLYDRNGIKISNALLNEYMNEQTREQTKAFINEELLSYLAKFTKLILQYGNYGAAINIYKEMLIVIAERYHISLVTEAPSVAKINTMEIGNCRKMTMKGIR